MKSSTGEFPEVLGNGQPEEEGDAHNEEVPHRVHVCELQERQPHRSWKQQCTNDHTREGERERRREKRDYHEVKTECSPTRPNMTQYRAANIVNGIDANKAPNFPTEIGRLC